MTIENMLTSYFKEISDIDVTPYTLLIQEGIIDSMGVMELITYINQISGVEFDVDDMTTENLGTISAIVKLIISKKNVS